MSNYELICSDIEKAAELIGYIGESASVSWTKEDLVEWLMNETETVE